MRVAIKKCLWTINKYKEICEDFFFSFKPASSLKNMRRHDPWSSRPTPSLNPKSPPSPKKKKISLPRLFLLVPQKTSVGARKTPNPPPQGPSLFHFLSFGQINSSIRIAWGGIEFKVLSPVLSLSHPSRVRSSACHRQLMDRLEFVAVRPVNNVRIVLGYVCWAIET